MSFLKFFGKAIKKNEPRISSEIPQVEDPPVDAGQASPRPDAEKNYWFFLSYFRDGREIDTDKYISSWSEALGRSYKTVINEFLTNGLILRAGVKEKLGKLLRAEDLKQLLTELGLSTSGKKDDLLVRYIEARPEEAEKKASKILGDLLVCTPKGREQVKLHERRVADDQDSAQLEMKNLLARGKIGQAAEVVDTYMKSVDRSLRYNYNDWTKRAIKTLMNIKKVRGLTEAEVEEARVNAAMELLWYGELKSAGFSYVPSYHKFDRFASTVIARNQSRDQLKEYSEQEFVTGIEIFCLDDACPVCKALAGRTYPFDKAPIIPIRGCKHEDGCRCFYSPVID